MSGLPLELPDKIFGLESSLLKYFLLPAVLVLLVVMSYGLVLMPRIEEIGEMKAEAQKIKEQKANVIEKKNYLLTVDSEELEKNDEYLSNSVLRDRNSYFLVNVIRKIADKHLFMVDSFNISPGELSEDAETVASRSKTGYLKIPVKINLLGPKSEYINLLLAMEKSMPILSIDKFDMKSKSDLVELDLMVSSYFIESRKVSQAIELNLTDLMLTSSELDLISRLNGFENYANMGKIDLEGKEYVEYERGNPFSL